MPTAPYRPGARVRRAAHAVALVLLGTFALAQLPPFLGLGYRLSWSTTQATLTGARLVPDPEGWLMRDGERYYVQPTPGYGGPGVRQLDVVVASDDELVADVRSFVDDATGGDRFVTGGTDVVIGDPTQLGAYWIAPTRLAAMEPGFDGTTLVARGVERFGDDDVAVVSIASSHPGRYASHTYDLDSGVLLFGGTVDALPWVVIADEDGRILDDLRGSLGYTGLRFLDARRLEVPWTGAEAPAWLAPGSTVVYEGAWRVEYTLPGDQPPPARNGIRVAYAFERTLGGAVVATTSIDSWDPSGAAMQPSTWPRVFASSGFDGLWIPPDALAQLAPDALLDRDPITGQDVRYGGSSGDFHVMLLQTPAEDREFFYDRASGRLTFARFRQTLGQFGVMVTELGLPEAW